MERAMMQGKTRTVGLLGTLGLILLLDGCAAIQREEAQSTENLLAAAGFKMKLADTAREARPPQNDAIPRIGDTVAGRTRNLQLRGS